MLLACASASDPCSFPLEDLDWDYVSQLSATHAVDGLLYRALQRDGRVPVPAMQGLAARSETAARQSLALTAELLRLAEALGAHGVRALAYKGPALGQLLYGYVGARAPGDLDFLVAGSDVLPATRVLRSLGYAPALRFSPRQQRAYVNAECAYDLANARGGLVDLHWALAPQHLGIGFDFEHAWQRHSSVNIGGVAVPVLSAEDTLLTLAIHGSKHLWSRLCWLHDLAACLRRFPSIDWDAILARAERQRAAPMLLLGLSLAQDLLAAGLPVAVRERITKESRAGALSHDLQQRYLASGALASGDSRRWSATLRLYGWTDRARCALRFLSTSGVREWSAVALPDRLFPLYTVVRLRRVISGYFADRSQSTSVEASRAK